jgi:hypothetical protein
MGKTLACAATLIALAACLAAPFAILPSGSISEDSYRKIRVGMARQQVEEILGGPPRDECAAGAMVTMSVSRHFGPNTFLWWGPEVCVWVTFDERGAAREKHWFAHDFGAAPPRFWSEIRRQLSW